ncbi:MAG: DUF3108 domain-containing protein [Prosthecobacter sp.]|jgi:hypothetical protein|uniref:DUF3108 domain-containing protein n=1 Tax=Prosthecobacter sp. TaxID=1965333 RepID=UPI0019E2E0F9|nr:DUF3108 domain-containing protein [Prosthecobacter sp.]MBE2282357.1 DUF3108 domain-containing protein [Prosthecobacter sp.]
MTRCLLTSMLICLPMFATARTPDWAGALTEGGAGSHHRHVPPCEISYELGWNNWVTAGKATLTVREAGHFWRADATAASTGFARTLWRYDCLMTSIMHRADLRAHYLQHEETDSAEMCRYRVAFQENRVVTETLVRPVKGSPTLATAVCTFGPMDDLLSVILHVRGQELRDGQKITRVVQPWDKPYLTTFEVLGRETLRFGGKSHPCIKVGLKIRKIDRTTLELSAYKKMKTATIWVSDDELRVPIEMHAEIFIGYMSARMTGLKMLQGRSATASVPRDVTVKAPAR